MSTSTSLVSCFWSHLKRWLRQFKCSVNVFSRQQARHNMYAHFRPWKDNSNVLLFEVLDLWLFEHLSDFFELNFFMRWLGCVCLKLFHVSFQLDEVIDSSQNYHKIIYSSGILLLFILYLYYNRLPLYWHRVYITKNKTNSLMLVKLGDGVIKSSKVFYKILFLKRKYCSSEASNTLNFL